MSTDSLATDASPAKKPWSVCLDDRFGLAHQIRNKQCRLYSLGWVCFIEEENKNTSAGGPGLSATQFCNFKGGNFSFQHNDDPFGEVNDIQLELEHPDFKERENY